LLEKVCSNCRANFAEPRQSVSFADFIEFLPARTTKPPGIFCREAFDMGNYCRALVAHPAERGRWTTSEKVVQRIGLSP
jgi:hypothetical protein